MIKFTFNDDYLSKCINFSKLTLVFIKYCFLLYEYMIDGSNKYTNLYFMHLFYRVFIVPFYTDKLHLNQDDIGFARTESDKIYSTN